MLLKITLDEQYLQFEIEFTESDILGGKLVWGKWKQFAWNFVLWKNKYLLVTHDSVMFFIIKNIYYYKAVVEFHNLIILNRNVTNSKTQQNSVIIF